MGWALELVLAPWARACGAAAGAGVACAVLAVALPRGAPAHRRRATPHTAAPPAGRPPARPQVTLVGKVLSAQESGLTYGLEIDDGTGKVAVKIWISDDGAPAACSVGQGGGGWVGVAGASAHWHRCSGRPVPGAAAAAGSRSPDCLPCPSACASPPPPPRADSEQDRQRRAEWRPGMHVRVHGHISSFGRSQEVVAFNIRPVTDHNEVRPGECRHVGLAWGLLLAVEAAAWATSAR